MGELPAEFDWKRHRPELDGLRAVAVLLVVLFHADLNFISGGFIGVDVFFTLSGFLITGILISEFRATGRIDLVSFYARRSRRLIPAALLVIAATSVVWLLTTSPVEREVLADDARSAALYFANWRFAAQSTDYFAQSNLPSPFLHFWSLSAEEQFYLVWPAALALLTRVKAGSRTKGVCHPMQSQRVVRRTTLAAVCGTVVSLSSLFLRWAGSTAPWSYFGSQARAYQLLSGACLAGIVHSGAIRKLAFVGRLGAQAGLLGLIALATQFSTLSAVNRGAGATVCALLVLSSLHQPRSSPASKVLGSRLLTWIGKHSYSIYLWHWPTSLVLRRYFKPSPWSVALIGLAISCGLAVLGARLLEGPVRSSVSLSYRPRTTILSGLALSLVVGVIVAPHLLNSNSHRVFEPASVRQEIVTTASSSAVERPESTATQTSPLRASEPLPDAAALKSVTKSAPGNRWNCPGVARLCELNRGGPFTVVLVGDSHLLAWLDDFEHIAKRHNVTLYASLVLLCPWQPRVVPEGKNARSCEKHHEALYNVALPNLHPDVVLTVTRGYDDPNYSRPLFNVDNPTDHDPARVLTDAAADSVAKILTLSDRLVIVRPWPAFAFHPRQCLAEATSVIQCGLRIRPPTESQRALSALVNVEPRLSEIDLIPSICPTEPLCLPVVGGVVSRFDNDHLTYQFALTLEAALENAMIRAGALGVGG